MSAINSRNYDLVLQLSDPDIELVGPRGSSHGSQLLQDWLDQTRVRLESLRTFVRDDKVVIAQHGVWRSVETGDVLGDSDVASQFRVEDGRVAQYVRYDGLDNALGAAELNYSDEQ